MRIWHVFGNMNDCGGAEEHLTTLAELQKAQGHDVSVCLIRAVTRRNQYARRLRAVGVRVCQWPEWLSRVSGDWDTSETILRRVVVLLRPAILVVSACAAAVRGRQQRQVRESVEGRVRTICGRMLRRERAMFTLLLGWHQYRCEPQILHLHGYGDALQFVVRWCGQHRLPVVYQEHRYLPIPLREDGTGLLAVSTRPRWSWQCPRGVPLRCAKSAASRGQFA